MENVVPLLLVRAPRIEGENICACLSDIMLSDRALGNLPRAVTAISGY